MNVLPIEKRAQILHLLVEGNSMRATSRIADVSINTVTKLLIDVGTACLVYQDETLRNLSATSRASAFNAMKSGRSASPKKRTLPRKTRALLAMVTATHGRPSMPIQN